VFSESEAEPSPVVELPSSSVVVPSVAAAEDMDSVSASLGAEFEQAAEEVASRSAAGNARCRRLR
jgi:hypothetical protein